MTYTRSQRPVARGYDEGHSFYKEEEVKGANRHGRVLYEVKGMSLNDEQWDKLCRSWDGVRGASTKVDAKAFAALMLDHSKLLGMAADKGFGQ